MGNLRDLHHEHLSHPDLIQPEVSFGFELVIMSHVLLWLLLVVPLLLQTHGVNSQGADEDASGEDTNRNAGTDVKNLVKRSRCQPREILVSVYDEFPDQVQYTIKPSCVPVQRCLGCCPDEALTCTATRIQNVTLEVLRIYPARKPEPILLSFVKHTHCDCRF